LNIYYDTNMKKLLVAALGLLCATAIVVQAQGAKPKKALTPEQQTVMKEMLAKYDTNKDGKLDKTERAAMTQADKDKMTKAGLGKKKPATPADASTNAPAATDK
jgi:ABC-type transporter MlaC component